MTLDEIADELQKLFNDTNYAAKGNWVCPEKVAIVAILQRYANWTPLGSNKAWDKLIERTDPRK